MKIIKKLFLIFSLPFLLFSCDSKQDEPHLIIGTSADNPPYEFMKNNKIIGFDIDLIEAIGKKLDKKVILKDMDFCGLISSLNAKNVDAVIAGLSETEERKKNVDFSDLYLEAKIATLHKSSDNFKNIYDLKGKVIGVQLGTIWVAVAESIANKLGAKVHILANNLMLLEELKSGSIDAIILEESQTNNFIKNNNQLSAFTLPGEGSSFAIALPKESNLKHDINKAIADLKKEGFIDKLIKKWLK